jgi:preprotein translocase subunit SecA
VVGLGGLYVLGSERHESRRIDNQLRGRSGRQGDPGESRFYLSLQDDLMKMLNAEKIAHIMEFLKTPPDVPIESKTVTRSIRSAQTQIEQQNFEIRKDLLKYDDVMNRQRQVVYAERREVLEGADMQEQIRRMINDVVAGYVGAATADGFPEEWDLNQLWTAFRQLYPGGITQGQVIEEAGGERAGLSSDLITEIVQEDAQAAYDRRTEELGTELMRDLERRVVLSVLDRKWREHLYEMDYLREGIGLRAMAQRDPLIEYQREGYDLFNAMMEAIKEESVGSLFNVQVQVQENPIVEEAGPGAGGTAPAVGRLPGGAPGAPAPDRRGPDAQGAAGRAAAGRPGGRAGGRHAGPRHASPEPAAGQSAPAADGNGQAAIPAALAGRGLQQPRRPARLQYSAPSSDGSGEVERSEASGGSDYSKVGRNAPCPCGSGRKFKQCHGDPRNR